MKYKLYELQALDYIQKKYGCGLRGSPFEGESLKLVINYKGLLIYGDLLIFEEGVPVQNLLTSNIIEKKRILVNESNLLSKLTKSFSEFNSNSYHEYYGFLLDHLDRTNDLVSISVKILNEADIVKDDSSFEPLIYNVKSLDGTIELPFILANMEDEYELVSIISA